MLNVSSGLQGLPEINTSTTEVIQVVSAFQVLLLQAGLALLEAGQARRNNPPPCYLSPLSLSSACYKVSVAIPSSICTVCTSDCVCVQYVYILYVIDITIYSNYR
jgi:hypothetical protein